MAVGRAHPETPERAQEDPSPLSPSFERRCGFPLHGQHAADVPFAASGVWIAAVVSRLTHDVPSSTRYGINDRDCP